MKFVITWTTKITEEFEIHALGSGMIEKTMGRFELSVEYYAGTTWPVMER